MELQRALLRISILFVLLSLASLAIVRIGLETSWRAIPQMRTDSPRAASLLRIAESPIGGGIDRRHLERLAEASPTESKRRHWLRKLIDTDPRDPDAWMALGLSQERDGMVADAEESLLAAARLSKRFDPAWTLANFYFRRQQLDEFWRWLQVAAGRAPDGYLPLVQLADRCAEGPGEVISRLTPVPDRGAMDAAHPDQPDAQTRLLWAYLDYLIGQQRLLDAVQVAERIPALQPAELGAPPTPIAVQSARRVAELTDRMITAGLGDEAATLWDWLDQAAGNVGLSFPPPDESTFNFDAKPSGIGFDWKSHDCTGVEITWQPGEIVARFDGSQPDDCVFLTRVVRLDAGQAYRVKLHDPSQSRPGGLSPQGLRVNLKAIDPLAGSRPSIPLVQRDATLVGDRIRAPDGGFAELQFLYQRPAGESRQAFRIHISQVELEVP